MLSLINLNGTQIVPLLLISALKGAMVLAAVWAALSLLKRVSASVRHWLYSLALLSTLVIPILALTMPAWSVSVLLQTTSAMATGHTSSLDDLLGLAITQPNSLFKKFPTTPKSTSAEIVQPASRQAVPSLPVKTPVTKAAIAAPVSLSKQAVILLLWAAGMLLVLLRWFSQTRRVWQITRQGERLDDPAWLALREQLAQQLGIRRRVVLVISEHVAVPLTWGICRPSIVLPSTVDGWSAERRQIVLLHELVHIARWDYLTQWFALLACAFNWFNPLAWKVAQYLSIEREQACDDRVLALGTKSSVYASNLLEISESMKQRWIALPGVLALGRSTDLAQRIRRILHMGQSRRPLTRTRAVLLLLIVVMLVLPLSTMQFTRVAAQNTPVTITLALPDGKNNEVNNAIVKDFETAHPGVTVSLVDANTFRVPDPADGMDAHFTAMQKYANSADVLYFEGFNTPLAPQDTRAGYLLDMAPLINSDPSFQTEDFYPQVWSSFQWDKGIWAVPTSAEMVLLQYTPSAFDRAKIAYPDGKWTLDDFANAINKLSIKDANGNVTFAGFANSGRIFREVLWRSLIGSNIVDESSIPNAPQLDTPAVETVLDTYHQLEQQGVLNSGPNAAMGVTNVRPRDFDQPDTGWSLLPGGKAGLMTSGVAISSATLHPDLAYALVKFLSTRGELSGSVPTRRSLTGPDGLKTNVPAQYQTLVEAGFANSLSYANYRFADYLNAASFSGSSTHNALQNLQIRLLNDLKAADSKKGTLALNINEPQAPTLPPGKIALKFYLSSRFTPLPNQNQWDAVIKDFTANDPQVGLIDLRTSQYSPADAAAQADCFYLSSNAVATIGGGSVLSLDPFINADPSFDKSDFLANVLPTVQRDNKTYALPIDIEPLILRYTGAQFSAAKLAEPTNNWMIETFVDDLKALKPLTQGQAPFTDGNNDGVYMLALIADYGGLPLDFRTNPPTINFTDPATVTAIQQALDLAKNGYIQYGALGNLTGGNGVYPTNLTALYPSRLNGFPGKKVAPGTLPDKAVLFPNGHQFTGLAYNLGTAYISAQSQNPEACYRFISTIAKHPELFSTMPIRRSLLANDALKAATNPDVMALYNQVDTLLKDAHTVPLPMLDYNTVSVSQILTEHWLFEAFDSYILNNGDLNSVLKDAETYAKGFQSCTAALPPLSVNDANGSNASAARPYADCAEKIDPRLKTILEPLLGH